MGKEKQLLKFVLIFISAFIMSYCITISSYAADDYPAKYKNAGQDTLIDEWNFYNRECTSFVAWCLNSRNNVPFHNNYKNVHWGNAQNWGNAARSCGITVDGTPAKGSVYWSNSGKYGHVAFVASVDGDSVRIEEYNYGSKQGAYNERTVNKGSASGYIHIQDIVDQQPIPPAPSIPEGPSMTTGSGQTIPDGDYHIVTALDQNKCLDVDNASLNDGANVFIFSSVTDDKQVFNVRYLGNGFYRIKHRLSGKYLDVAGNDRHMGTNVQQWGQTDAEAQEWSVTGVGNGFYTIQSKRNSYFLDVEDGNPADRTNVRVWEGNGSSAQKWCFVPWGSPISGGSQTIPNGDYHIVTGVNNNMCLDIANAETKNGTNAWIWHSTQDPKQVFTVTWLGAGKGYKIVNKHSGKCLEVAGNDRRNGANVQQWDFVDNPSQSQYWVIDKLGNTGYYTIRGKGTGFYLDVDNGKAVDKTNVQVWEGNGTIAQKWRFVPWATTPDKDNKPTLPGTDTPNKPNTDTGNAGNTNTGSSGKPSQKPNASGSNISPKPPVSNTRVASLKINKKKLTLARGKSYRLKIKNAKQKVKWSSNKKSVATVSKKGIVKAKKKGKAVIIAKIGNKKLKCKVTVTNKKKK